MSLIKWEPMQEIEGMFDRYAKAMGWPTGPGLELINTGDWTPRVDISETADAFAVKVELPGVKKEDIKVSVDKGSLTVQGERKQEEERKDTKFHRIERFYGNFVRSFTLPDNIDESRITAAFNNGVLELYVAKTETPQHKTIKVPID